MVIVCYVLQIEAEYLFVVFVLVTRSIASASMGVGYSGIVKLCRYLDMKAITHTTYAIHRSAVTYASKETACNILDNAHPVMVGESDME